MRTLIMPEYYRLAYYEAINEYETALWILKKHSPSKDYEGKINYSKYYLEVLYRYIQASVSRKNIEKQICRALNIQRFDRSENSLIYIYEIGDEEYEGYF